MDDKINDFSDLEIAAGQLQDAIISAYNDNCPLKTRNLDLANKRKETRRLFNVAKITGQWTEYNKALREAKRASWRRHCEEIEQAPECARVKTLGVLLAISN